MESIAKIINALTGFVKTIADLDSSAMLWVLLVSIFTTLFICCFLIYFVKVLKRVKKDHDAVFLLHQDCLKKTEDQNKVINQIAQSNKEMAKTQEWMKGMISRVFDESFQ